MSHTTIFSALRILAVLSGAWLVLASPAGAQWYVSGNAGAAILDDADATDSIAGGSASGSASFDTGYAITGAVGYSFGRLRLESEISYRSNDLSQITVDSITVGGTVFNVVGAAAVQGRATAIGFMGNGWYDFNTDSNWVPFIGGGIGGAVLNLDIDSVAGVPVVYDRLAAVLAYQGGIGLAYRVTPFTNIAVSYRYFGTTDPVFNDGVDRIETEHSSHSVMLGYQAHF